MSGNCVVGNIAYQVRILAEPGVFKSESGSSGKHKLFRHGNGHLGKAESSSPGNIGPQSLLHIFGDVSATIGLVVHRAGRIRKNELPCRTYPNGKHIGEYFFNGSAIIGRIPLYPGVSRGVYHDPQGLTQRDGLA